MIDVRVWGIDVGEIRGLWWLGLGLAAEGWRDGVVYLYGSGGLAGGFEI